jgi:hypothetical protein
MDRPTSVGRRCQRVELSDVQPAVAFALWGPALAGAAQWNGKMYEGIATLASEWLNFVTRRLKDDLRLPQHLCACRSPEAMRDVQLPSGSAPSRTTTRNLRLSPNSAAGLSATAWWQPKIASRKPHAR